MVQLIQKVAVLGGGSAGWMAAAYLYKAFEGTVDVTVIESPTIPRIGVGEATIPNLQSTFFDFLGIPEQEWMVECRASFKGAVRFSNWRTPASSGIDDHFYHPFDQIPVCNGIPLSQFWFLDSERRQKPLDYSCFTELNSLDALRSPRTTDGTQKYSYAWHFDAQLLAEFLMRWATQRGVKHVRDTFVDASIDNRGHISSLHLESGRQVLADLFVDCSGFRGLLINKVFKEPFIDMSDRLLCDSAVATAFLVDEHSNVEPYTSSIALNNGWVWRIPQFGRVGTGYVYSGKFVSQEEATQEFLKLWDFDESKT